MRSQKFKVVEFTVKELEEKLNLLAVDGWIFEAIVAPRNSQGIVMVLLREL